VFSSWHTDTHTAESGERDAAARRPHKPNDLDGRLMKRTETHAQPNNCERSSTDRKVRRTPHASHRAAPPPSLLVRIISIGLGDTRSPPTSVGQQPGQMQCLLARPATCVFITSVPCVCLLLQYLLQNCSQGGGGGMEDMCYERLRAEAGVN